MRTHLLVFTGPPPKPRSRQDPRNRQDQSGAHIYLAGTFVQMRTLLICATHTSLSQGLGRKRTQAPGKNKQRIKGQGSTKQVRIFIYLGTPFQMRTLLICAPHTPPFAVRTRRNLRAHKSWKPLYSPGSKSCAWLTAKTTQPLRISSKRRGRKTHGAL